MRRAYSRVIAWLGIIAIGFSGQALSGGEPQFDIIRSTIDGGGVIRSAGGEFELSGTIGQPDAGAMTGGVFELTGGFWIGLAPTDCNEDGIVDGFDHEIFVTCMWGPDSGIDADPCPCFDIDLDGSITLQDFAKLQRAYVGQ